LNIHSPNLRRTRRSPSSSEENAVVGSVVAAAVEDATKRFLIRPSKKFQDRQTNLFETDMVTKSPQLAS